MFLETSRDPLRTTFWLPLEQEEIDLPRLVRQCTVFCCCRHQGFGKPPFILLPISATNVMLRPIADNERKGTSELQDYLIKQSIE